MLAIEIANLTNKKLLCYYMNQYQLPQYVTNLIGPPKGIKGYKEGGMLVNDVRKYPDSIVLFDMADLTNKKVIECLIPIFTNRLLNDASGRKPADFSRTVIIFTTINRNILEQNLRINFSNIISFNRFQ